VLDLAFPEPRDYTPFEPRTVLIDPAVASCCTNGIADSTLGVHRWDCCYATVDASVQLDPHRVQAAEDSNHCSPWGPPCPPAIPWSRRGRSSHHGWTVDLRTQARRFALSLSTGRQLETLRPAAIETWLARMVNEFRSASVFAGLAEQFATLELLEQAALLRRFAADEQRHGAQCGAVVEALGGTALASAEPPSELPAHPDAGTALEAAMRNLLSVCCLSETVAVALISAERWQMPAGPLRSLLARILADEVTHARFGWRTLDALAPGLDEHARARLAQYLRVAFAHLVEHELRHLPAHVRAPALGTHYGLCDGAQARALFRQVVREAIVPGLEARGLAAADAWRTRLTAAS
jgi:hypothetical protein